MEYTPQEVAKLLANRPHQPHYVEWLIEQCLKRERAADHETLRLAAVALQESEGAPMVCDWMDAALEVCRRVRGA